MAVKTPGNQRRTPEADLTDRAAGRLARTIQIVTAVLVVLQILAMVFFAGRWAGDLEELRDLPERVKRLETLMEKNGGNGQDAPYYRKYF